MLLVQGLFILFEAGFLPLWDRARVILSGREFALSGLMLVEDIGGIVSEDTVFFGRRLRRSKGKFVLLMSVICLQGLWPSFLLHLLKQCCDRKPLVAYLFLWHIVGRVGDAAVVADNQLLGCLRVRIIFWLFDVLNRVV